MSQVTLIRLTPPKREGIGTIAGATKPSMSSVPTKKSWCGRPVPQDEAVSSTAPRRMTGTGWLSWSAKRSCYLLVLLFLLHGTLTACLAQSPVEPNPTRGQGRTMGGKQLWTDHFVFQGWRIQRYVLTGHHRLLNSQNRRQAWGSFDHCRQEFDRLREVTPIADLTPRAIFLLLFFNRR